MSSASLVAKDYRLQQWASQVKACQSRPAGQSVADWCRKNGIHNTTYYYRLKTVREAFLKANGFELDNSPEIVRISSTPTQPDPSQIGTVNLSVGDITIQVDQSTPMNLLSNVLKAVSHVK